MAITFKEKRFYLEEATSSLETLSKEGLTFKEKRPAPKKLSEALEKIRGDKTEKSLYQRLVDGEFNSLPWQQYFEKLKEACEESGADLATACLEATKYLKVHYDPVTDSMKEAAYPEWQRSKL